MILNMLFFFIKLMDIGVNGVNLVFVVFFVDWVYKFVKGYV